MRSVPWYFMIGEDEHIYLKRTDKILKGYILKLKTQEDQDGSPTVAVSLTL